MHLVKKRPQLQHHDDFEDIFEDAFETYQDGFDTTTVVSPPPDPASLAKKSFSDTVCPFLDFLPFFPGKLNVKMCKTRGLHVEIPALKNQLFPSNQSVNRKM